MSASMASYPLLKILHNYRYILIPALVFTTEMTVWAALNLKGVGDMGWVAALTAVSPDRYQRQPDQRQ